VYHANRYIGRYAIRYTGYHSLGIQTPHPHDGRSQRSLQVLSERLYGSDRVGSGFVWHLSLVLLDKDKRDGKSPAFLWNKQSAIVPKAFRSSSLKAESSFGVSLSQLGF